jgi:hypothetical protein
MRLFVEFSSIDEAKAALEALRGFNIDRQTVEVAEATPAVVHPLYQQQSTPAPMPAQNMPALAITSASPIMDGPAVMPPVKNYPPILTSPLPTVTQTYTLEQLAVAATPLADGGQREALVGLLASFGVQALTQLPKEHYGNFATQLRAMGAKI